METHNRLTPILFSSLMVEAILSGDKKQTRRIVKFPKDFDGKNVYQNGEFGLKYSEGELLHRLFPKYEVGTILWVRETWQYVDFLGEDNGYVYKATDPDWDNMDDWKWKPSIFMPKEACRLFLKITDIKAERLHDITEEDAIDEGVLSTGAKSFGKEFRAYVNYQNEGHYFDNAKSSFKTLWDSINNNWDSNPWVWKILFQKTEKPKAL